MRKTGKFLIVSVVLSGLFILGGMLADMQILQENLIRLHVVANSDTAQDQENKLAVRDAVIAYLQEKTSDITTVLEAKDFLNNNLEKINSVVNDALQSVQAPYNGTVALKLEEFSSRKYDTFSLPSGIYNSLRIELGNGAGKNWWCVAFPALCTPNTTDGFRVSAIDAGLQETLVDTISDDEYKIRFFLLDCIGKIENFFHFA